MSKHAGNDKAGLKERLCHALDVPPDLFPNETFIELRGRSSLCVSGAGGVTLYTDRQVRFALRDGELCIKGRRLCCTSYHKDSATVDGLICSVSFEGGKGETDEEGECEK